MRKMSYSMLVLGVLGFLLIFNTVFVQCTQVTDHATLSTVLSKAPVKITPKQKVVWSFNGSNPDVNITLQVYTEKCYLADSWMQEFSSGHTNDSGEWNVPEVWSECGGGGAASEIPPYYFVFINDHYQFDLATVVSYTLIIDEVEGIPGYYGILLVSALSVVLILVLNKKSYKIQ